MMTAVIEMITDAMHAGMRSAGNVDWMALAALIVSLISLLVSLPRGGARPRISLSRDFGMDAGENEFEIMVSNGGADAMFDVTLEFDGGEKPARTPRIESGGVWTLRRTFGETAGELREPDDEVRPLPKTVGRATIRYRTLPFTFIPRRRRFRPSDYDRRQGPTDSELIAG